jgi:hypothetical protein
MAEAYKVLGQVAPAATTETSLYIVPAATSTVVSTLVICNRSSSNVDVRVAVVPGGGSAANVNYILYDVQIIKNQSEFFTIGMSLETTDEVRVYSSTADTTYSLFGTEIT